ncbi:MAG: GntR family transcriptional regulator [Lachnospiraceae bacterium]|jgi:DNA-binding GntR family transcriptional regulator|nr:GntR family transcriptional regulator [Lachnospiraceae bacterium]
MDKLKEGFTQIKKESLTDRIHDSILEMIIKNPSDEEQVLNEKRLMELFGVSKAPVREALIKLCSEGVLRNVPRFGYMVIRMNEQDIRDALRMRVLLETEALETAFPNLEERELAEIRDHVSKAAAKQNVDVWEVWEDNKQFHLLLASFSGNRILMKLLQECMEMLTRSYAQKMWDKRNSMADSVDEAQHYGIYQKLCDKDLEGAIALLECDINSY